MLLVCLLSCCQARHDDSPSRPVLRLFVAASLAPLISDAVEDFSREHGVAIEMTTAASSTLARQIESGLEGDLFLAADPAWVDRLEQAQLADPRSRMIIGTNQLAVVMPRASDEVFVDQQWPDPAVLFHAMDGRRVRVATGDPLHVPLGGYALAALNALGIDEEADIDLVPAQDARAALRLVELNEVDRGIVFASDARSSARVRILTILPEQLHPPITYVGIVLRDTTDPTTAAALLASLIMESTASSIEPQ